MTVTIFHNPKCGTSRNVLAMIRESGVEPAVVDYLKAGWEPATLEHLASVSGVGLKGLLRKKEAKAAELLASDADDATVLAAMIENPNIVERPIVETSRGVALCRPSEAVFPLLDNPPTRFVKEDGEVVGG